MLVSVVGATISFSSLQFSSRKMATAKPENTPDFVCGGTRVTGQYCQHSQNSFFLSIFS